MSVQESGHFIRALVAGAGLVVAGAMLGPASAAMGATAARPYHDPPWLNLRGAPLALRYGFARSLRRGARDPRRSA